MTKKQEHLLMLFKEIDGICKKHGLRYILAGGTLIGAVRNEGFIPWDDDMDLCMPREDWEKFAKICRTELPPGRVALSPEVDRNYTNSFPRYIDTSSSVIHKHQIIGRDPAGEVIDVFVLDPIPDGAEEYEKYRTYMMIYSELIINAAVYCNRWEIPVRFYLKYLLMYLFLGKDKTLKELERKMFSYKEGEGSRYAMRWGGCPFLFEKDMLLPVKSMNFEGEAAMVPHCVSDYLIWHYGDEWSYIPPHGEQIAHEAVCAEGISYQELRNDYMPKVNRLRLQINMITRKIYHISASKKNHRIQRQMNKLRGKATVLDLQNRINDEASSLKDLIAQRKFKKLSEIFSLYYQVQLSAAMIGREDFTYIFQFYHPVLLELDDDIFYAAVLTLFYTERVAKAHRLLKIREEYGHMSPEMQQLLNDIFLFRTSVRHYEMREEEKSGEICRKLMDRYPDHPSFLKLWCRIIMEEVSTDLQKKIKHVEDALSLYPEDGYFLKYRADILWEQGDKDNALRCYADAREKTQNGITQLEMDKFLKSQKEEILELCKSFCAAGKEKKAKECMQLWHRLLPEDKEVKGYLFWAEILCAETMKECKNILSCLEKECKDSNLTNDYPVYKDAFVRLYEKMGYSHRLAEIQMEIFRLDDITLLDDLADEVESYCGGDLDQGFIQKTAGDIRYKQGHTSAAFQCYETALKYADNPYLKTELADMTSRIQRYNSVN